MEMFCPPHGETAAVTDFSQVQSVAPPGDRGLTERRILGAFYTPERVSQFLADWAVVSPSDTVLEPSFGGCGFLACARNALHDRGAIAPTSQIYGCDIDPVAFSYLEEEFGSADHNPGFVLSDFLDCSDLPQWPAKFTVVLANPPYIPHHRIGKAKVKELASRKYGDLELGGRSSLWAYFIAQSIKLLDFGGRMAWVLPGAFLQADYAQPIREYLAKRFDRSIALIIRERIFLTEGTDEETVVLLAKGHRKSDGLGHLELGEAQTLDELGSLIAQWEAGTWKGSVKGETPAGLSMSIKATAYYQTLLASPNVRQFGDIAKTQIGIVTGANEYFVLSRPQLKLAEIEEKHCSAVLSKFRAAPGVAFTNSDVDDYALSGGRAFLISSATPDEDASFGSYLAKFSTERRNSISTFKKRQIWSQTCDGNIPDAFFPVMHHTGPRLVLNDAACNCTNTIHRVFFKDQVSDPERRLACISMISTFSQISAEIVGRRYGSGVLKHEPRDAEKILLMMPQLSAETIDRTYVAVDELLRAGDAAGARLAADAVLLRGISRRARRELIEALSLALEDMRIRRRPKRGSKPVESV